MSELLLIYGFGLLSGGMIGSLTMTCLTLGKLMDTQAPQPCLAPSCPLQTGCTHGLIWREHA